MEKVHKYMKELKAVSNLGIIQFQELLIVVSKFLKILVYMHYDGENPVVYRGVEINGAKLGMLHLQCLSEVHYNCVIEKFYEKKH